MTAAPAVPPGHLACRPQRGGHVTPGTASACADHVGELVDALGTARSRSGAAAGFDAHCLSCAACRREVGALGEVVTALRSLAPRSGDAGPPDRGSAGGAPAVEPGDGPFPGDAALFARILAATGSPAPTVHTDTVPTDPVHTGAAVHTDTGHSPVHRNAVHGDTPGGGIVRPARPGVAHHARPGARSPWSARRSPCPGPVGPVGPSIPSA